jgi:hypothetical protein
MSTKLTAAQEIGDSKLLNVALALCATEVGLILVAVLVELALGHRMTLISRISAISWLMFGGAIIVSIVGFAKGRKRLSSISIVVVCVAIFVLCAFRFALV